MPISTNNIEATLNIKAHDPAAVELDSNETTYNPDGIVAPVNFSKIILVTAPHDVTPVDIVPFKGSVAITATLTQPAAVNDPLNTGVIKFTFNTSANEGQYGIFFNIPVVGFESGITNAITWFVRGGTEGQLDTTGDENGGIPLSVAKSNTPTIKVGITTPQYP